MTRVVVVAKRSNYSRYIQDEQDPRAVQLIAQRDPSVKRWLRAHEDHMRTLEAVERVLERLGVHFVLIKNPAAVFDAADADLVTTVGGDGTLLAASHNVANVPILGVNSSPRSSVGFYCAARLDNVETLIPRALEGRVPGVALARMAVALNGRTWSHRVLNEALFCHSSPAATSRYILGHGRKHEEQRSSGLWVGPAPGSTAAQRSAGGKVLPLTSKKMQAVVREPYVAFGKAYSMLKVIAGEGESITVKSKMHDASMFLDGPYKSISVRLGDVATFSLSKQPLRLLGVTARRTKPL
jgi:NAD+ kinase